MKVILRLVETDKFTISDGRRIKAGITNMGYVVDMQPTEVNPVQYVVTKEYKAPVEKEG